jgi:hypothetical protein
MNTTIGVVVLAIIIAIAIIISGLLSGGGIYSISVQKPTIILVNRLTGKVWYCDHECVGISKYRDIDDKPR